MSLLSRGETPQSPRSSLRTGLSMSFFFLGETPYTSWAGFTCFRMDRLPGGPGPQTPRGSLRSGLRMRLLLQKLAVLGIRLSSEGPE